MCVSYVKRQCKTLRVLCGCLSHLPLALRRIVQAQEASDFLGRSYLRTYRSEKVHRQLIVSQFDDGNPVGMP